MQNKLSVVVPVINLWNEYTKNCIDTLFASTYPIHQIILIDNASTDCTEAVASDYAKQYANFVYIRNAERRSVSASWNQGTQYAISGGATHVVVINNDTLLHTHAIENLMAFLDNSEGYGVITGRDISRVVSPNGLETVELVDNVDDHPDFAFFLITAGNYEIMGGFDEEFTPAYFEDNSFAYKTKLAGLKYGSLLSAPFYHFGSRTQNTALGNGQTVCPSPQFENNRKLYVDMWGGNPGEETYKTKFNK